ncbi:MAG: LEA type 2 family protein [Bacteroidia bacterium]
MKNLSRLLLFFACIFLSSCQEYKEVKISSINDFKVKKLGLDGIEAEVSVTIDNPNTLGFNVYRSKAEVSYGGVSLGQARLKRRVHIAANSKKEHTFTLKGSLKNATLGDITSLLAGKKKVELKGHLKVGRFFYRRKFPIDLKQFMNMTR